MKTVVHLLTACILTLGISGCASKRNPLIDEPLAKTGTTAESAAATGKSGNAANNNPGASATGASTTGVQTTAPLTTFQRFLYIFTPFRVDVQQGNFISQEQVALLKEGMTRDQVRFVLGSPLLTDVFHADRWDYAFRVQKGSGETTSSKVTVFFKDDKLARFTGKDLPTEQDYIARLAGPIITSKAADKSPDKAADKPASPDNSKPETKPDTKVDAAPAAPATK